MRSASAGSARRSSVVVWVYGVVCVCALALMGLRCCRRPAIANKKAAPVALFALSVATSVFECCLMHCWRCHSPDGSMGSWQVFIHRRRLFPAITDLDATAKCHSMSLGGGAICNQTRLRLWCRLYIPCRRLGIYKWSARCGVNRRADLFCAAAAPQRARWRNKRTSLPSN